jgi:DICT domain-containing protein
MSETRRGISQSEQHKAARAAAMLGKKNKAANSPLSIKIEVFDKETNKSSSFDSIREAAIALNIDRRRITNYLQNNQEKLFKGR